MLLGQYIAPRKFPVLQNNAILLLFRNNISILFLNSLSVLTRLLF